MTTAGSDRQSVAFLSDYLPRRCGIATFTADLCEAVAARGADQLDAFAVALNDIPEGYSYPQRVRFEVRQNIQADYRTAAEFLNIHQVSTVCMQHEYGIFGGPCGSHILALLKALRQPLVTTLHTVLSEPSQEQRHILESIARYSDSLVVLSRRAVDVLRNVYNLPSEKIEFIPHGIPDVPFVDSNYYKDQFGAEGRRILLTFGLLSPGKGIEYAIQALPAVVRKHPDVLYIVLGATHPHVKRDSGEEYRTSLARMAYELKVGENVRFVNRFVDLRELCEYLGAADLYVTPYLNAEQIVSGTLAYAMGAGKAIVSTPYWYAQEMLADGRGRLVPFRDSDAMAAQLLDLLDNETERHAMRKRAYTFCRQMTWPQVASQYMEVFEHARSRCGLRRAQLQQAAASPASKLADASDELPEIDLRHLRLLTDDTGLIQHCRYTTPDRRFGYSTDDNARALIVAAMYERQTGDASILPLLHTYMAFIAHAMDENTGRFRNFLGYDHKWSQTPGSEDSHARAMWALGATVGLCVHKPIISLATRLFAAGLNAVDSFASPRACAFVLIGLHEYLRRFAGDSDVRRLRGAVAERMYRQFIEVMSDDWPWNEETVTYSNAKLPQAMMMSGQWLQRQEMIDVGVRSLDWLLKVQTGPDGRLSIIGTNGWYKRGGQKARFDQQPIDAHALIEACIEAYHVTRDMRWAAEARKAFRWFQGSNDLRTPLYDSTTGGCRDGLHEDRVNLNQGAESTLAWLLSLLLMHGFQAELTLDLPDRAGNRDVPPKADDQMEISKI